MLMRLSTRSHISIVLAMLSVVQGEVTRSRDEVLITEREWSEGVWETECGLQGQVSGIRRSGGLGAVRARDECSGFEKRTNQPLATPEDPKNRRA